MIENDSKFEMSNYESRNYEYKRVSTFKTYIDCISFAFNTNNTILFVGQHNSHIKVLGLNNHTKLIQKVKTISCFVVCLIWRKKSNSLISGHPDKIIIWDIWNQLTPFQILEPISGALQCMILNEDEDLLVSGGIGEHIQFWKKESKGWISSQVLETPISATCLSFNDSQNKLILCGGLLEKYIVVIEQQGDKRWAITQTMQFQDPSYCGRICFINDNKFAYQTSKENYLQIYGYNQKNNKFQESQRIEIIKSKDVYWGFPSQFSKERNILMVKQGEYINYFSQDSNGDCFLLKNSIKFGSIFLSGRLSFDGLYQVIWDGDPSDRKEKGSHEIQIRKIKYLNE